MDTNKHVTKQEHARRYTIEELLQLRHAVQQPFNLAKFSYAAARAGLVPPLDDCAMSLRRTSGNRVRGWSSESIVSMEDTAVQQANENSSYYGSVARPTRQPLPPPADNHFQKDEGFARFLKKHSSPTHNRVTARGRIVPMEKRLSPPKFGLTQNTWFDRPYADENIANGHVQALLPAGDLPSAAALSERDHHLHQAAQIMSPEPQAAIKSYSGAEPTSLCHGSYDADSVNIGGPTLSAVNPVNTQLATLFDPVHASRMKTGAPVTTSSINPQQGPVFAPYDLGHDTMGWYGHGSDPYVAVSPEGSTSFPVQHPPQSITTGQCLEQANLLYGELDAQLKAIDRHRAVSNHNPNVSAHRMAIVQRRADVKAMVHRLQEQLAIEKAMSSQYSPELFPANATFPMFVPPQTEVVPTTAASTKEAPPEHRDSQPLVRAQPKSKAIPILPPPDRMSVSSLTPKKVPAASDSGAGGPVLPRAEDCRVTEDLRERLNDLFASVSVHDEKQHDGTSNLLLDRVEGEEQDHKMQADSGQTQDPAVAGRKWIDSKPGRAPKDVEEFYEMHLDAMRLPKGVMVRCSMPGGGSINIPGSDLRRPILADMTDFEKDYWHRKPLFTVEMFQSLQNRTTIHNQDLISQDWTKTLATSQDHSAPNIMDLLRGQTQTQPEVFGYKDSSTEDKIARPLGELSSSTLNRTMSGTNSYEKPKAFHYSPQKDALSSANRSGVWALTNDRNQDTLPLLDQMSNKGYSSVCVQDVHATIRPPPAFDGTEDAKHRSAVSMLTAASKNSSPRLVQRITPTGGV